MRRLRIGVGWCMLLLALRPCPAQTVLSPGSSQAKQPPAFPLTRVQSVTFVAQCWSAFNKSSTEVVLQQGPTFKVKARRPDGLRMENILTYDDLVPGYYITIPHFGMYMANGKNQLEYAKVGRTYFLSKTEGPLEKLRGRTRLPDRINADILFDPRTPNDPTFSFAFLQNDTLNGEAVAVYTREFTSGDTLIRHRMSLSAKTGLPARISIYTQKTGQALVEETRADYSQWELNPTIPDSEFDPTPPPGSKPEPTEAPPNYDPKLAPGQLPKPLQTHDTTGKPVSLSAYRGHVVLLDYWAAWCGPCLAEMPAVRAAYAKWHKQGLDILGISLDDKTEQKELHAYLKANPLPWPLICDQAGFSGPLVKAYSVNAIPFSLLIGRDGKIVAIAPRGPELEAALRKAMGK